LSFGLNLNSIKVYILPFDIDGSYSSEWIEVTKYVSKISRLSQDTDSSDYQLGVYKNSSITISLSNRTGKFNDVDSTESIFAYKRRDSKVKIIYKLTEEITECGCAKAGDSFISEDYEVYKGLLSDETFRQDAYTEEISITVLGFETIFDRVEVPYASISNGDAASAVLYTILNQTAITDLLTVSAGNISVGSDQTIDDKSDMENATVRDVLDELLLASNSVLYILNDTIYIKTRAASAALQYTFYGQGSPDGIENIISIKDLNNGMHRLFNYFTWKDTTFIESDTDSKTKYGVRKNEISIPYFTNSTKCEAMLSTLLAEFKDPKTEMIITTPLNYTTLAINLLDKVNVDYPVLYIEGEFGLPICGIAICGSGVLPDALWSLSISSADEFKVMKKDIDMTKMEITFKLRGV